MGDRLTWRPFFPNLNPYIIEGGRVAVDSDRLQHGINDRQKELHHAADIIASSAQRQRRASAISKVVIIILGAIAATSGAATQIAGEKSVPVTIIYTAVGLLIATVGGIEAAFKFGDRGAELTTLAATCQSTLREIDSRWKKRWDPLLTLLCRKRQRRHSSTLKTRS